MASPSRCRSSSPRGKGSGWTRGKGSIWNGPSRPVGPPVRVGRRRSGARKLHGMPTPGLHPGVRLSLRGRMMRSATRLDWLGTEQAYLVLGAARRLEAAGHQVVHLEIGEPDVPTPPHVVEAGVGALRDGLTRYALAAGVPELRDALTPRPRVIILNPPHNPGGGVAAPDDVTRLAALAQQHDLWVISDEVYGQVRYDGKWDSIAALPGMAERTFIVDGFSKAYSMTGWRLGYGVMPQWLADPVTTLLINNISCTATFVQYAGIAALTGPQDAVKRMVSGLRGKRDQLVRGLTAIEGITCATPAGAFYCFPDVSGLLERTGQTCESLAERLLEDAHVAVLAGSAFGPGGKGHLRMCYATDPAQIDLA